MVSEHACMPAQLWWWCWCWPALAATTSASACCASRTAAGSDCAESNSALLRMKPAVPGGLPVAVAWWAIRVAAHAGEGVQLEPVSLGPLWACLRGKNGRKERGQVSVFKSSHTTYGWLQLCKHFRFIWAL